MAFSLAATLPLPTAFQYGHRPNSTRCMESLRRLGSRVLSAATTRLQAVTVPTDAPSSSSLSKHYAQEEWPAAGPSRLTRGKRAFVEEQRIRGCEVGPDQHTTIATIANLLQEVASNHAVAMWGRSNEGFATHPDLEQEGLIFVMTRMQIQIECYPRWGDLIEIETWFQEHGKIGAQRDFVIRDKASGEVLGRCMTTWVMINMNTRRLAKMPDVIRAKLYGLQMNPPEHAIAAEYRGHKIPDIEEPAEIAGPSVRASRADMDMNGHINNVTYLSWALETVPEDVYNNCHLYQVELDFKAECRAGADIECLAQTTFTNDALSANGAGPNALSYVSSIRRCEDNGKRAELVRCRTTWRAGEAASR